VLAVGDELLYVNRRTVPKFENIVVDEQRWPCPVNPAAYFYPKTIHNVVGLYNVDEHQGMDFEFILAAVQAIEPLYIDVVLGNWRHIPGTKTFDSHSDSSIWALKRKIRRAAWKRASLKTKLRTILLWSRRRPYYRLKLAYWDFYNRRAARRRMGLPANPGSAGSA